MQNRSPISRELLCVILLIGTLLIGFLYAETVLREGFEDLAIGSINSQAGWTVSSGSCTITDDSNFVNTGLKAARFTTNGQSLVVNHTAFSGTEAGISGILYLDVWVRIKSMTEKDFALSGYDLFGGSQKRAFVLEFDTPTANGGDFRIYDGSSKTTTGQYVLGDWNRLSARIDYDRAIYTAIFNNGEAVTVNFREEYTPSASGSRQADVKEFHQLRINLGYDSASGSVDAALDDIYIGSDPLPDITFPVLEVNYTITVEQPEVGSIALSPDRDQYPENSEVTAILTLPEGYLNLGWTGDLSGTELVKTFTVSSNMTISAAVGIDLQNPPEQYVITVNQPDFGSITLNPIGETYFRYTNLTATVDIPVGCLFEGWTGDLSGTDLEQQFVVLQNMVIGAIIVQDTTPARIYSVSNSNDFKNCCRETNLRPGDIVEVSDGSYTIGGLTIESSGTSNQPILIRSKNIGGAILVGESYFDLRRAAYIQIEGFDIRSNVYTVIKLQACHHIRITRNFIHLTEIEGQGGKWILIGGIWNDSSAASHHNRIDHNLFENKHQLGNFITIDGQQEPINQMSQYDYIDCNYFRNIGPRAVNEMEAIRVGVSDLCMSSAYCVIESNLFEECNGDPEIISVKSCDNVVRQNTFRRCQGTLCLRHGNRNEASGNFFFGEGAEGTGGIRVYGNDHKIFNNYFERLTGTKWDAPITLTNGDYDGENSGGLSDHWRVKRATICHNTLVDNNYNIEIGFTNGGKYSKTVKDVIFANNLVLGRQHELIDIITQPDNVQWRGNIMFPDSTAILGLNAGNDEISVMNPMLVHNDNLWRLSSSSPAVDAATDAYDFVTIDIDGQDREGIRDIGADEYSGSPIIVFPLIADDVGPLADETSVAIREERIFPRKYRVLSSYPNPFNLGMTITFTIGKSGNAHLSIYNLLGQKIAELADRNMVSGNYSIIWNAGNLPSGVYWLRLEAADGISVLPISLLK